jgi:anti-sigma factor RsiW
MKTEMKLDCKACRSNMADLLLDSEYAATYAELSAHLTDCAGCRTELEELRATMAFLDEYAAPEPSPYFDTRLHARLREVQAKSPEGFFSRWKSFLLFSTGRKFQPAIAAALALVLVLGGGGTFWQMYDGHTNTSQHVPVASATVNDLTILDNNAQAEQQMGQLLDISDTDDSGSTPTS